MTEPSDERTGTERQAPAIPRPTPGSQEPGLPPQPGGVTTDTDKARPGTEGVTTDTD